MLNRLNIRLLLILTCFVLHLTPAFSQDLEPLLKDKIEKPRHARIMFYNCENLFDAENDSLTNDEEFLPEGDRHWSNSKYYTKLNKISKVITATGGWTPVELVGLCEIENEKTLYDLTHNTPLYLQEYNYIHRESPDRRGIDVALLYQPKSYKPLKNTFINIEFEGSSKTTRDILYSKGLIHKKDTLHIFVNHWPSRWGGQLESEQYRMHVASILRSTIDSIQLSTPLANIIIMGDLNDTPENRSVSEVLKALSSAENINAAHLYNLSSFRTNKELGTHKYNGVWSILDQIIVSGTLINKEQALQTTIDAYTIMNADFLLENDDKNLGIKPYRTFVGFSYNNGYSDHLPIFIDLNRE